MLSQIARKRKQVQGNLGGRPSGAVPNVSSLLSHELLPQDTDA